jgi:hypothetical protein
MRNKRAHLMLCGILIAIAALPPGLGGLRLRAKEVEGFGSAKELLPEIDSVALQMQAEFALYREGVQDGWEHKGWTEQQRIAALQWLEEMTSRSANPLPDGSDGQRLITPAFARFLSLEGTRQAGVLKSLPGSPTPAPHLSEWLAKRINAFLGFQNSLLCEYADKLIPYAEDVWIRAKTPADFQPAVEAFGELKKRDPQFLGSSDFARMGREQPFPWPRGDPKFAAMFEFQRIRNETFEVWLLVASEKPLFLPDPEVDPEGFWKARQVWLALRRAEFSFLERPRMAAHFVALNRRFRNASIAAREQLDGLILEDAPSDRLATAVERLHAFEQRPVNLRNNTPPFGAFGLAPRNYGEVLARSKTALPMLPTVAYETTEDRKEAEDLSAKLQGYDLVLALRRAEEAGEPRDAMSNMQTRITENPGNFSEAVQFHLRERLLEKATEKLKIAETPNVKASTEDPVAALITELVRISSAPSSTDTGKVPDQDDVVAWQGAEAAKPLSKAWQTLSRGDSGGLEPDYMNAWQWLAMQSGSLPLFTLRQQAARALLAQIMKTEPEHIEASETLPEAIRIALGRTIADSDWKKAIRIMALDTAADALPQEERGRWKQVIEEFSQTGRTSESAPKQGRALYLRILKVTTDSRCAAFAAQRLKELSATKPQQ